MASGGGLGALEGTRCLGGGHWVLDGNIGPRLFRKPFNEKLVCSPKGTTMIRKTVFTFKNFFCFLGFKKYIRITAQKDLFLLKQGFKHSFCFAYLLNFPFKKKLQFCYIRRAFSIEYINSGVF